MNPMNDLFKIIDGMIDVSEVPQEKRNGDNYDNARKHIHDTLATLEDVEAGCYHEAGHLIYATNFGFALGVDVSEFRILGPHIKYHPATDTEAEWYEPIPMAISTPGLHKNVPYTSSAVLEMAKIGVAGGESVEYFQKKMNKPMWKRGDPNDQERFKIFAKGVLDRVGKSIDFPHNYWADAKTAVGKDFEQELYASDIEREAMLAMLQVFPLAFLSMKGSQ